MALKIETDLEEMVTSLAGHPIDSIEHMGGGGNSRIFRVQGDGRVYALKSYPLLEEDPRDRLGVEAKSLTFMESNGITDTPHLYAIDAAHGFSLMEWIDGTLVGNDANEADIDHALNFIGRIARLTSVPGAAELPRASESCISGTEILRQIEGRLKRLEIHEDENPELAIFLNDCFRPALAATDKACRMGYADAGFDFTLTLERSQQALVPADFGFHNAIRRLDGRLAFIDFEYFGWDDPVKLAADFLLHPGMCLSSSLKQQFATGMTQVFGEDLAFAVRLKLLYPLFALRWALILLNEFLPERWHNRALAGNLTDWDISKKRQLDKAADILGNLEMIAPGRAG